MLRREDRIGHAEARVRPSGEDADRDLWTTLDDQVHLGPFRAADPVSLHRLDPLRPLERVEALEQLVGIIGDLEEPLLEISLHDEVA